ncbi:MAG: deoxyribose-phosphate aldolase, partial [Actinomycetia bacterium]|nr:deoxyribose-phosphate aldolase [Actinomycetes bacterium]
MMGSYTRDQMAAFVDHTLLKPEATEADIVGLVAEATELGVFAVCVSPPMVSAARSLADGPVVASVVGFPSGKHLSSVKADEARLAFAAGAVEIDMVIDIGTAISGVLDLVRADIAAVREAVPETVLKVIVESAALLELRGEPLLVDICRVAEDAGADFVKTSTG